MEMTLERTHVSCREDKLQETLGNVSNGSDSFERIYLYFTCASFEVNSNVVDIL